LLDDVIADARVVFCERDEYLRVVIQIPIGCSECVEDIAVAVLEFLLPSVLHKVDIAHVLLCFQNRTDALYLVHQPVGWLEHCVQGLGMRAIGMMLQAQLRL
jgi:hypothetical protein